jgi:tRNA(Ile)-lysidine synthase
MSVASGAHPIIASLNRLWPVDRWRDARVIVAVSGGPDSIALASALRLLVEETAGSLILAHVHHGLRAASDDDERFVRAFAGQIGLECHVHHARLGESAMPDGLEAAAREARYRWFEALADELEADFVAVGHTADDQAETILHHIARGTGLAGLAGMPLSKPLGRAELVRPLLEVSRETVIDFLGSIGQAYRTDESNDDLRLTRNAIRREILPRLAELYPGVSDNLRRLGQLASETQAALRQLAERTADVCVTDQRHGIQIECHALLPLPDQVVRETFVVLWRRKNWPRQSMGFREWQRLAELVQAPDVRRVIMLPGEVRAERLPGGRLLLSRPTHRDVTE